MLPPDELHKFINSLSPTQLGKLKYEWRILARPSQLPPKGNWRIWLIMAGRGFGKTRAGAEWVHDIAAANPHVKIALLGDNLYDVRATMVEGDSGILSTQRRHLPVKWESSLRQIIWANGAAAYCYSAQSPEALRGPQHSHAWCDELTKWEHSGGKNIDAWDNLAMGLRLGKKPQILVTTTPRRNILLQNIMARDDVVITKGTTQDNRAALPPDFIAAMEAQYGQSNLGRQELSGELLCEIDGALWTRPILQKCRIATPIEPEQISRIIISVDPPASDRGDECGIIVAAGLTDGRGALLYDGSIAKASPEKWARQVANLAENWGADHVVAEANQGGDMVGSVLRAANINLPIKLVHASRGKMARAEPVAALYEAGRVVHAGRFDALEDQLCGMMIGGNYEGPGRSPDRADALVWAMTELMLGRRAMPKIRF
ncbi:ATP-binding protein [Sphingorhabdus lutea]|uniref:ATP-binding protein n=2 Tax=Sphingorhabdus lutea TaxID=1913578 RepID=A0A1L3JFB7_9SPHN|nr:ATP-binding protein [Sphingorhabdus lutea]